MWTDAVERIDILKPVNDFVQERLVYLYLLTFVIEPSGLYFDFFVAYSELAFVLSKSSISPLGFRREDQQPIHDGRREYVRLTNR